MAVTGLVEVRRENDTIVFSIDLSAPGTLKNSGKPGFFRMVEAKGADGAVWSFQVLGKPARRSSVEQV